MRILLFYGHGDVIDHLHQHIALLQRVQVLAQEGQRRCRLGVELVAPQAEALEGMEVAAREAVRAVAV